MDIHLSCSHSFSALLIVLNIATMLFLSVIRHITDYPAAVDQTLRGLNDLLAYVRNAGDPAYGRAVAQAIRDVRVCAL